MRLSDAQILWLADPRAYSHPWCDRTFRALLNKGAVVEHEKDYGSGRSAYRVTKAGQEAWEQAKRAGRTPYGAFLFHCP